MTPTAGAVKIPVRNTEVGTQVYDKLNGVTYSAATTSYETLTLSDMAIGPEVIDGYTAAAVPDGLVAERLDSAGYAAGKMLDTEGLKARVDASATTGLQLNGADITTATVQDATKAYEIVLAIGQYLDEKDVPNDGRWMIVNPEFYSKLISSPSFIKKGDLSQEMANAGAIGECNGFAIFKSNNIPMYDTYKTYIVAGHPDYCTRVVEWSVEPSVQDFNDGKHIGSSYLAGRMVFGHYVKPEAFVSIAPKE